MILIQCDTFDILYSSTKDPFKIYFCETPDFSSVLLYDVEILSSDIYTLQTAYESSWKWKSIG